MIKELKFLIADIDGTLVNTAREMLPITKAVLDDLHSRGILLGLASGRPIGVQLLNSISDEWGISFVFDCYIGMNGGQIIDPHEGTDREIYPLEPPVIREILEKIAECGLSGNPFIYVGEDILTREMDELMSASVERHKNKATVAESIEDFWQDSTAKILWRLDDPADMPAMEQFFAEHPSPNYIAFKTQANLMEVQDPRVNKGVALKEFLEEKQIPKSKVMAFGDMTNDIQMLKEAGWGVCLKQGSEDTRAAADDITEWDNENDGFGRYMIDRWYIPNGWEVPKI